MIILGSAGILLFNYRGYNKLDDILNSSAGAFGLGICLFPCAATMLERIGTFQIPAEISDTIHMISAIGFFAILAYNSMFQFTKGSENPTPNKLKRNLIFRICGGGMATSFAALPIFTYAEIPHAIWWVEMVALTFFGVSWLTKANCIPFLFRDKE
jgi:hypothetical protein